MNDLKEYFRSYAQHAKWANELLQETIDRVGDVDYYRVLIPGVRAIHHLLNHVIVMDELWLSELRQDGPRADIIQGDQLLYPDRESMRWARAHADQQLIDCIDSLDEDYFAKTASYETYGLRWPIWLEFAHVFRHQVHHRGQLSAAVCLLGFEPPKLDPMFTPPHLEQTPVMEQIARLA